VIPTEPASRPRRADGESRPHSTQIKASHPFRDRFNRGEENDRHAGFSPQAAADGKAIQLGQHHVEHHQVGGLVVEHFQGLFTVLSTDDAVARQLQAHHQDAPDCSLVINDENGRFRL